jgi:hypothetical protein
VNPNHISDSFYTLLSRKPPEGAYRGLSHEASSILMAAICLDAATSGRTVMASYHLDELRKNIETPA